MWIILSNIKNYTATDSTYNNESDIELYVSAKQWYVCMVVRKMISTPSTFKRVKLIAVIIIRVISLTFLETNRVKFILISMTDFCTIFNELFGNIYNSLMKHCKQSYVQCDLLSLHVTDKKFSYIISSKNSCVYTLMCTYASTVYLSLKIACKEEFSILPSKK